MFDEDALGLSFLDAEPGILDFRELLIDLVEPCVSDLEKEGSDSNFGPKPVGVLLLLRPLDSPSLEG